ncbi:MAG: DUF1015 domain-containing protein [Acidimicrobiales bacterium]
MPHFAPFPGIRYAEDDLDLVTAPPYDVIDAALRASLAARHPHNAVHIDLPVDGGDPYAEAGLRLERWRRDGVLTTDDSSLYLYRMRYADELGRSHDTLGVIGALGIEAPGAGDVLPHEHTTPKAASDRLQLLRGTAANLSPIWGLSLARGLSMLLDVDAAVPLGAWHDADAVEHALWRIDDAAATAAIAAAVSSAPVVIADGHHRYETSRQYRDERRASADGAAGAYDATLCFVVELIDDQLTVQPIHRLLEGLPEHADVAGALAATFAVGELEPLPDATVTDRLVADEALALVTADGLRTLTPRPEALGDVADLDSARLDVGLRALPEHRLRFQHGVENVVRAVSSGEVQAGVLLRPVSVDRIQATAHARGKMPPKSTFFWPKPRTGTVFRSLT